jgi:TonB-dependent SusC/RagA subfamily outer membrane receptor
MKIGRKHLLIIVGMAVIVTRVALAQTGSIKGLVLDDQTGGPIPGANVFLEKTAYGTASDAGGNYLIIRIPPGSYTLVASLIGYRQTRQTVLVRADEVLAVTIRLKPGEVTLSPIVVTAIGTQAEREKLGVSVSSVEGSSITRAGGHDVISNLAALAPGVNTSESTGDPGSATRIVLRGVRSLMNDNQPLIVLDGIPINTGISTGGGVGGTAAYSRVSDINTEDIQSVELYKGPSAASLWGSRAANGVISITTRSGGYTPGKKMGMSIRSRTFSDELLYPVSLQTS